MPIFNFHSNYIGYLLQDIWKISPKYIRESFTVFSGNSQILRKISQNMKGKFHKCFGKFQMFEKYCPNYDGKFPKLV